MKNPLIILLPALLMLSGCAAEKKIVLPIDARFANVCYTGYTNESRITTLKFWPEDSVKHEVLMRVFDEISASLERELKKYEKRGRYRFVDRKDIADIRIHLVFNRYKITVGGLTLPVEVRVRDMRSNRTLRKRFKGKGTYPHKEDKNKPDYYYHYYGTLLNQARRNFPAWQIAQLFYPHTENNY